MYVHAGWSVGGLGRVLAWCTSIAKAVISASSVLVPRGDGRRVLFAGLSGPVGDLVVLRISSVFSRGYGSKLGGRVAYSC